MTILVKDDKPATCLQLLRTNPEHVGNSVLSFLPSLSLITTEPTNDWLHALLSKDAINISLNFYTKKKYH
jgi:hypothetical protein